MLFESCPTKSVCNFFSRKKVDKLAGIFIESLQNSKSVRHVLAAHASFQENTLLSGKCHMEISTNIQTMKQCFSLCDYLETLTEKKARYNMDN